METTYSSRKWLIDQQGLVFDKSKENLMAVTLVSIVLFLRLNC